MVKKHYMKKEIINSQFMLRKKKEKEAIVADKIMLYFR